MSCTGLSKSLLLVTGLVILGAEPGVSSEVALLRNGRSLLIEAHEAVGDRVVLVLGETDRLEFDRQWIESITSVDSPPSEVSSPTQTPPPATSRQYSQDEVGQIIKAAAARNHLAESLLSSMIRVESNFNPGARSSRGAQGLMQLMPDTVDFYGVKNSLDARENVEAGARYLKDLLQQFHQNLVLALAAYNAGPSVVSSYRGVPPFPETQNYIRRVLALLR